MSQQNFIDLQAEIMNSLLNQKQTPIIQTRQKIEMID